MSKIFFLLIIIFFISCTTDLKHKKKYIPKEPEVNIDTKSALIQIDKAFEEYNRYTNTIKTSGLEIIDIIDKSLLNKELYIVTILAVGDIIPHGKVKQTGVVSPKHSKKNPDFSFLFEKIKYILKTGDIVFGNLETPIRPDAEMWKSIPFKFNTPIELVKTLEDFNFNILNLANNHSYDQGVKGISTTITELNKLKIPFVGIGNNYEEGIKSVIIEKKGIKFGFLGFTDLINNDLNQYDPKTKKGNKKKPFVNRFELNSALNMITDLKKNADIVIVSIHWGQEYHSNRSLLQKKYALAMIKSKADIILGHHPHVLQPVIYKGKALVAYSLGNFVSNQFFLLRHKTARHKEANREGAVLELLFERDKDNKAVLIGYKVHPTLIKQDFISKKDYRIFISPLTKSEDKKKKDNIIIFMGYQNFKNLLDYVTKIITIISN